MQRLQRRLDRLRRKHRRAVAAAFDEVLARHHRVPHQVVDGEFQRLLDHAVDDKPVLRRIDVGNAGMQNREVQRIGRDGAVEHLQRRARMLSAGLALRIAERAHDRRLEPRRLLQHRGDFTWIQAPLRLDQRLGCSAGWQRAGAKGASEHDAAAKQGSAMQQAVAGNEFERRRAAVSFTHPHAFLLPIGA